MEEDYSESTYYQGPLITYGDPVITDDTWVINLRNLLKQKEKIMISNESKKFILNKFNERLSVVESGIERVQMNLSHYGKQMHDLIEERRKIKEAVYDLEHGNDNPDEEDES